VVQVFQMDSAIVMVTLLIVIMNAVVLIT